MRGKPHDGDSGALSMKKLRRRSRMARGGIIGGLLKLIGLVVVGLIGLGALASMLERRPTPAPEPIPVAVAPGPIAKPVPRPVAPAIDPREAIVDSDPLP